MKSGAVSSYHQTKLPIKREKKKGCVGGVTTTPFFANDLLPQACVCVDGMKISSSNIQ